MNIIKPAVFILMLLTVLSCGKGPSVRKMNERMVLCEKQYQSSSWTERQESVREVSGYRIGEAHAFLMRAANDENPAVRIEALRGTQNYFHDKTPSSLFIRIAQNDSSQKVRIEAMLILASYKDPSAFPVFTSAFRQDDWLVREAAIKGITAIEDKDIETQSVAYIVMAIRDPDENVRIAALTTTRIKDQSIYDEIRQLFYEKDYERKVTLLTALLKALKGYDLDIRLRERVKRLIIHDNEEVRILALRVLKSEPAYRKNR